MNRLVSSERCGSVQAERTKLYGSEVDNYFATIGMIYREGSAWPDRRSGQPVPHSCANVLKNWRATSGAKGMTQGLAIHGVLERLKRLQNGSVMICPEWTRSSPQKEVEHLAWHVRQRSRHNWHEMEARRAKQMVCQIKARPFHKQPWDNSQRIVDPRRQEGKNWMFRDSCNTCLLHESGWMSERCRRRVNFAQQIASCSALHK